jgi:hypothetical protein
MGSILQILTTMPHAAAFAFMLREGMILFGRRLGNLSNAT